MFILITMLSMVFMILLFYEEDYTKSLVFGGISVFLGLGAYRLSYDGTNYQYSFIPLVFVIISVVWMIYTVYSIIAENNKKDWGKDIEGMDNV